MRAEMTMTTEGLEKQAMNINRLIATLPNVSRPALIEAGLIILHDAQKNCPVLTGNLKSSGDIVWTENGINKDQPQWKEQAPGGEPVDVMALQEGYEAFRQECAQLIQSDPAGSTVCIGFSAYYAIFVHELHKTKPKFLENSMRANTQAVMERINARIRQDYFNGTGGMA